MGVRLNTATNWNAVHFQRLFYRRGCSMEKMAEEQRPAVTQSKSCCKRCLIFCVLCESIILCLVFAGFIYWKFFSEPEPPFYEPPPPPPQQPPPSADDEMTGDWDYSMLD